MALDNAQFIAELSITDPPGSDPLSQGDDQIRTIKRATQQSFPNIDKAVTQTADQMLLMAIKNEANVFSVPNQVFTDENFIQRSATTTFARWGFRNELGQKEWEIYMNNAAGLDTLVFQRRAAGVFVDTPMVISHADGVVRFLVPPTIAGDPIWTAGEIKMLVQGASLPSTNWFLANGTNGTVALQDRILGAQGVFTGNQSPFLDAQTTVGPATGNTGLTEAQMPSHRHRLRDLQTGGGISDGTAISQANSVGTIRNVTANIFTDASLSGNVVENTGSGNTHGHTIPELEVETASNDAFQVMPFTYFMQVIQYVP